MGLMVINRDTTKRNPNPDRFGNPVQEGLQYSGVFNEHTANFLDRNYAPGLPDAIVTGTPVVNGDGKSVRFTSLSNFIQTNVDETKGVNQAITVLIVARTEDTLADNSTTPAFFGGFAGPPANGTGGTVYGTYFRFSGGGNLQIGTGRGTTGADDVAGDAVLSAAGRDFSAWEIYTLRAYDGIGSEGTAHINYLRDIGSDTGTRITMEGKLRIGSSHSQHAGHSDISQARVWAGYLSDAQLADEVRFTNWHMSQYSML